MAASTLESGKMATGMAKVPPSCLFLYGVTLIGTHTGRMTYTDGSRYEGQWKNDKRDGPGILYWPVRSLSLDALDPRARSSSQKIMGEHRLMRYEGFWREDRLLDGGQVCWDDGTTRSLEDALKRLN